MLSVARIGYLLGERPDRKEGTLRRKAVPVLMAAGLLLGATGVACDKEDRQDVKEVGTDVEKGVDQLDSDGKDD